MVGFIYNNSRMSDVRSDLVGRMSDQRSDMANRMDSTRDLMRAGMKAETTTLRTEFAEWKAETNARFDRLDGKVDKLTETVLQMPADHAQRIGRLEQR